MPSVSRPSDETRPDASLGCTRREFLSLGALTTVLLGARPVATVEDHAGRPVGLGDGLLLTAADLVRLTGVTYHHWPVDSSRSPLVVYLSRVRPELSPIVVEATAYFRDRRADPRGPVSLEHGVVVVPTGRAAAHVLSEVESWFGRRYGGAITTTGNGVSPTALVLQHDADDWADVLGLVIEPPLIAFAAAEGPTVGPVTPHRLVSEALTTTVDRVHPRDSSARPFA